MDMESYGLIGLFVTLQAVISVLDIGVSATLTRELARNGGTMHDRVIRGMARAFEKFYWFTGIVIALSIAVLAPWMTQHWIQPQSLSVERLETTIGLIGLVIALQWPVALYSAGLIGLQRQVLLNLVLVVMSTVRAVGAVAVLVWIAPRIEAFFLWQGAAGLVHVLILRFVFWRLAPGTGDGHEKAHFSPRQVWRFAAGMGAISATALILTQMDRIILSRMLSLEVFGYYMLAATVAAILYRLAGPVFSAVYPRLTQLVSTGDHDALRWTYHRYSQLVSVLVFPSMLAISLFSYDIMFLWTGDSLIASNTHIVLALLVTGTALNCLMYVPYALQLAHGWTRLTLLTNIVSIGLLIPLLVVMTDRFGSAGAAVVWLILNASYVLVSAPIMYRRLLPDSKWVWYLRDLAMPLLPALAIEGIAFLLIGDISSPVRAGVIIGVATFLAMVASAFAAPEIRSWIVEWWRRRLRHYRESKSTEC